MRAWIQRHAALICIIIALGVLAAGAVSNLMYAEPAATEVTYTGVTINDRMEVEKRTETETTITRELIDLSK
jgi:hypothetical protein